MKDASVARKYSRALFAEALVKKELLACQQGLEEIVRVTRLRKSLPRVLSHPFIPPAEKRTMTHAALGEYATPLLELFLDVLIQKKRLDLLFLIAEEFQSEVDRHNQVQPLRVRTAYALSEVQQKTLKERLEKWLKTRVRMEVKADPALIGGWVIQTRDCECDVSLRGRLTEMKRILSSPRS